MPPLPSRPSASRASASRAWPHARRAILAAALVGAGTAGLVRGEFPEPRLTAIHPPGGQQGSTVDVTVVGTDLDELERLEFFHPGITSAPITTPPGEFDVAARIEPGRVRVTIAADVPPGPYDAVAVGRFGLSNPRIFMVGSGPEAVKTAELSAAEQALDLSPDGVVSGRTAANAADHFAVMLAAGTRLRAEVWGRRIDSRLDGVLELLDPSGRVIARAHRPRDEDPVLDATAAVEGRHVLRLHDRFVRGGDEYFYRLAISTAPVVEAVFPPAVPAGAASVRLTAVGRGLPDATAAAVEHDPPGLVECPVDVQPGSPEAGAAGRPLRRLLAPRDSGVPLVDLHAELFAGAPAPIAAVATRQSVTVEQEPNDEPAQAMPIALPAVVAGRANPRGDRDWFSFEATAGDTWVFDLFSRRLGMPTDMALMIQRVMPAADGEPEPPPQEVASADDGAAEFAPFGLPPSDPTLVFTVPADGTYRLLVRELAVDSLTGVDRSWVLDVRRPDPGFDLVAMLSQPDRADANKLVRAMPVVAIGGSTPVEVLVVRRDGFAGEVVLEAKDLPAGVSAPPTIVPAAANRGTLVLTAAEGTAPLAATFRVVGRSVVPGGGPAGAGETTIVRTARSATLRWDVPNPSQPQLLRETGPLPLAVTLESAPATVRPQADTARWETTRGGTVTVPLSIRRRDGAKGTITLAAAGLPKELKVEPVTIEEAAEEAAVVVSVGENLPLGTHVVQLKGVAKTSFARNPQAAERLRADLARVEAIAAERQAQVEVARAAVTEADGRLAAVQAAGEEPPPAVTDAAAAARRSLEEAEARVKAAEEERARREQAATEATTASAAKDIDVPIVLPPITIVVAEPPQEAAAPQEPPQS
jgi:hypothetical protein